jgi:hypothetical protein
MAAISGKCGRGAEECASAGHSVSVQVSGTDISRSGGARRGIDLHVATLDCSCHGGARGSDDDVLRKPYLPARSQPKIASLAPLIAPASQLPGSRGGRPSSPPGRADIGYNDAARLVAAQRLFLCVAFRF